MIVLYGVLSWAFTLGISIGLMFSKCFVLEILERCENRIGPVKFPKIKEGNCNPDFFVGFSLFQVIVVECILGVLINLFLYNKLTPLSAFMADLSILFLLESVWLFIYFLVAAWKTLNINIEQSLRDYVETPIVNCIRSVNSKYYGGK